MEELKFGDLLVSAVGSSAGGTTWRQSVILMYLCPRNLSNDQFWGIIAKDDESIRRSDTFSVDRPFPVWAGVNKFWAKKEKTNAGS